MSSGLIARCAQIAVVVAQHDAKQLGAVDHFARHLVG